MPLSSISSESFTVSETGAKIVRFNGSDYNVPYPADSQLVYSVYLRGSGSITRYGPESFSAIAYCD